MCFSMWIECIFRMGKGQEGRDHGDDEHNADSQVQLEWEVSLVLHVDKAHLTRHRTDDVPTWQGAGLSEPTTVLWVQRGSSPHPERVSGKHPVERFESTFWNYIHIHAYRKNGCIYSFEWIFGRENTPSHWEKGLKDLFCMQHTWHSIQRNRRESKVLLLTPESHHASTGDAHGTASLSVHLTWTSLFPRLSHLLSHHGLHRPSINPMAFFLLSLSLCSIHLVKPYFHSTITEYEIM